MNGNIFDKPTDDECVVAVLFGGEDEGYEKSCEAAADLYDFLTEYGCGAVFIGTTREGARMVTPACSDMIRDGQWEGIPFNRKCAVSFDNRDGGFLLMSGEYYEKIRADFAVPLLYNKFGADIKIFNLLEGIGIDHIGSKASVIMSAMDSIFAERCAQSAGIEAADSHRIKRNEFAEDPEQTAQALISRFGFPMKVMNCCGKWTELCEVKNEQQLAAALAAAAAEHDIAEVRKEPSGRRLAAAVAEQAERKDIFISEICEYTDSDRKELIKADIDRGTASDIKKAAAAVFESIEARDFAVIGFVLTPDGRLVFDYIDLCPGLYEQSFYNRAMKISGLNYVDMLPQSLCRYLSMKQMKNQEKCGL